MSEKMLVVLHFMFIKIGGIYTTLNLKRNQLQLHNAERNSFKFTIFCLTSLQNTFQFIRLFEKPLFM